MPEVDDLVTRLRPAPEGEDAGGERGNRERGGNGGGAAGAGRGGGQDDSAGRGGETGRGGNGDVGHGDGTTLEGDAGSDPAVTSWRLRQAAADGEAVWLGVVRAGGEIVHRHVRPTRVAGGLVHGVDLATGRTESWAVSRITGVDVPPRPNPDRPGQPG